MADPFTMTAMVAAGAGAVVKAGGDLFAGQAQAGMYKYQAGVSQLNAQIASQNARWAIQKGETAALRSGIATAQTIGQQKAGQAASGIDVNKGSAVAVRDTQQNVGNYDEAIIRTNAAKEAYGYRVQSLMDTQQAGLYDAAASNAKTASYISAAGSLLGGAGSVASKWTAPGVKPDQYGGE